MIRRSRWKLGRAQVVRPFAFCTAFKCGRAGAGAQTLRKDELLGRELGPSAIMKSGVLFILPSISDSYLLFQNRELLAIYSS